MYSCRDGFELRGDMIRTCQNTSQWSGEEPSCVRVIGTLVYEIEQTTDMTDNILQDPSKSVVELCLRFMYIKCM